MRRDSNILNNIDWLTILVYGILVIMGWLNIYASVYQEGAGMSIFDFSLNSGKQLIWIGSTIIIFFIIVSIDFQFYESVSYILYGIILLMLIFVVLFGAKISGARSWVDNRQAWYCCGKKWDIGPQRSWSVVPRQRLCILGKWE